MLCFRGVVLVLSCLGLVLSCVVLSCLGLVLSCLVLSCLVLSCLVLSCLVLSCLRLFCLVISCLVLPCLCLSCSLSPSPACSASFPPPLRFFFYLFIITYLSNLPRLLSSIVLTRACVCESTLATIWVGVNENWLCNSNPLYGDHHRANNMCRR